MWSAQIGLWLGTLLLAGLLGHLVRRRAASRGWRIAAGLLLAGVLFYPLMAWAAQATVSWLYLAGPDFLTARFMPSRGSLPLAHYQRRVARLLDLILQGLALAMLIAVVFAAGGRARWRSWGARVRRHPLVRILLWSGVLLLVAFGAYNIWLHMQFLQPHPVFYTDCHKVWGHRGHPEPPTILPNTIASYERAFDLGAAGVEMDVRYDLQRREYFIGRYDEDVPPPGQRLTLEQVFTAVGDRGYFWLDVKTIAYLTPRQAQQAAADLALLLDRYDLRARAIVESDTPENLAYFAQAGLHTSYWIFNLDEDAFPRTPWGLWWALVQVKQNYIRGGFSAISMDRRFYTPLVAWMLRGARVHLFTVNEVQDLQRLVAQEQVRVILTDTARYDIDACR